VHSNTDEMLEWVEFITDKFATNHVPWKYSRRTGTLRHIRYARDYTGYNHWKRRVKRFIRNSTVDHWKPKGLFAHVKRESEKTFWYKLKSWPMMIAVHWRVSVCKDKNLPDGQVNGIITHWEEDGEYITMFCPYVGRHVLEFLRKDPTHPSAIAILNAMKEVEELSWPEEDEDD